MKKVITLLLVLTLFGCATNSTSTKPASPLSAVSSEYLKTAGGGFLLKSGKPMYAMTYTTVKQIPTGVKLRVSFENPQDLSSPFVTEVDPEGDKILIRSKPLNAIKNRKNYKVIVELVKGNQTISTHVQHVRFDMPEVVLDRMGITTL